MGKQMVLVGLSLICVTAAVNAEDFTVVALPDTQKYTESYPDTYHAQTQWIADNAAGYNIEFVTHLGDIVENAATLGEWDIARVAMDRLDNGNVPYGTCVGNHDLRYPGDYYDPDAVNYWNNFGPQYYQDKPWYGGASPNGLSNYQVITVGGVDYLFLHILVETPAAELAWAQTILAQHQHCPVMVSTHRYLYDWRVLGDGRYGDFQYTFEPSYRHDGLKADDFFSNFVALNRNIYAILCGHCDGEHYQVSYNSFGLPVHEMLSDYQNTYGNGGNGWMRLLSFRPDANEIYVQTYSPTLNDWRTGSESQFLLGIDLEDYTTSNPTLRFREGYKGYVGTQDTWVNEDSKNSSYGNSSVVIVDDDTANSFWNDYKGQGLFRFDHIFQGEVYEGDPTPTRIPDGATIHHATMTINLSNDCDLGEPEFYVYRMTRYWDEGSTWNSLSGGINVGSDTDPSMVAMFYGDNNPDLDWHRTFSVLPAVQAWADGAPNYGFAVIPQPLDWNDDGIDIRSSEDSDHVLRPELLVEFSYDVHNTAPTVTQMLDASTYDIDEGQEVELTLTAVDPNPLDPLVFTVNDADVGYATGSGSLSHLVMMEENGFYSFDATVSDDEATVDGGGVSVTVHNVAPEIVSLTEDATVWIGETFVFAVEASDAGIWDVLSYHWDLNDDLVYDDLAATGGEFSSDVAGSFVLRVEVADDDGGVTYGEILVEVIAAASGDVDHDGDVDLDDYLVFQDCLAGPGAAPSPEGAVTALTCLGAFDFDVDDDVDLGDFAVFTEMFLVE